MHGFCGAALVCVVHNTKTTDGSVQRHVTVEQSKRERFFGHHTENANFKASYVLGWWPIKYGQLNILA